MSKLYLFPERIKAIRFISGLSMDEFSKKVGVSKQSISKYENGLMKPKIDNLESICKAFDLSFNYFTDKKVYIEMHGITKKIVSKPQDNKIKSLSYTIERIYGEVEAKERSLSSARKAVRIAISDAL
jgi:transcriptional regulator with XRE-family HTH domain